MGTNLTLKTDTERYGPKSERHRWPVSIDYLENIQQIAYWKVQVKKFGSEALKPPKRISSAWVKGAKPTFEYGPDLVDWIKKTHNTILQNVPKDPADLLVWQSNQTQEIRSQAIKSTLQAQHDAFSAFETTPLLDMLHKQFEVEFFDFYLGILNEDTKWLLVDQLKSFSTSTFVAVRCHCNLLLSTLNSGGSEDYRKVLRKRAFTDLDILPSIKMKSIVSQGCGMELFSL
jgi:hypothetical protein